MADKNDDPMVIKQRVVTLGVGPSDLAGCKDAKDEFNVILRKSAELKVFSDPSEYGYASRIREINRAERFLQEKFEESAIRSFSDLFAANGDE